MSESTPPMYADKIDEMLDAIAQRIVDGRLTGPEMALIGIRTRGVPLSKRLAQRLSEVHGYHVQVGAVDITLYRDDLTQIAHSPVLHGTEIPFAVDGKEIILVDDVFFTGRTVRAAMNALCDLGRPAAIRLAVLIDRGHRELPIQPDYSGLTVETTKEMRISVRVQEVDGEDSVTTEGGI